MPAPAAAFDISGGLFGTLDDHIHGLGIVKSLGRAALAVSGVMVSTTLAGSSGASILETDAAPVMQVRRLCQAAQRIM